MIQAHKTQRESPSRRWLRDVAAVAVFLTLLAGMSWRLYEHRGLEGPATADRWALGSYRDATYYPLRAVYDGVNPYDTVRDGDPNRYMQRYPVYDTLPLYSPLILMVFAPLAVLPYGASGIAFTAINVVLFVVLAWVTLRVIGRRPGVAGVFGLATLLLASQPGRGTFNAGQVAVPLAIAALGALHWGDRKAWKSSAYLAFLTLKPTSGGPLGLLLAARRDWRSMLGGFAAGGILCVVGIVIIFSRSGDLSVAKVAQVLLRNQSDFAEDPTSVPQTNKGRIDIPAVVEYLAGNSLPDWGIALVAVGVLAITGWVLWRADRPGTVQSAASTTSALAILAMFVCVYHNIYDLPLLIVPIAACATAAHASWKEVAPLWRWILFALLVIPMVNFFWTDGFRLILAQGGIRWGASSGSFAAGLYAFCCAANGLALTIAWAILLVCVARGGPEKAPQKSRQFLRKQLRTESVAASPTA